MYIAIRANGPVERSLTLEEPDDCTRFHLEADGVTPEQAAEALTDASAGRLDPDAPDDAWIDPDAVRRMAEGRVGDDWEDRFEGMLGFAASKGWIAEDGFIQAHCEWGG